MVGVASEFLVDNAKELLAGVNADFGVDVADVTVGGTGGDKQRLGNERLIAPLHEQPHGLTESEEIKMGSRSLSSICFRFSYPTLLTLSLNGLPDDYFIFLENGKRLYGVSPRAAASAKRFYAR